MIKTVSKDKFGKKKHFLDSISVRPCLWHTDSFYSIFLETCTVSKIRWQDIKLPCKKLQQRAWNWNAHKREFSDATRSCEIALSCCNARSANSWDEPTQKRTKKRNLSLRVTFGFTHFISLYVRLSQTSYSTKTQGRCDSRELITPVWRTSVSIPPGQTVPVPLCLARFHILPHNLFPSYSRLETFIYSFPSSWVSSFYPIQSPHPFFPFFFCQTRPCSPHTDIPQPPGALLTLSPFLPNSGSRTISQWNRSSLSVQTCRQEPWSIYIRERRERQGGRKAIRRGEKGE